MINIGATAPGFRPRARISPSWSNRPRLLLVNPALSPNSAPEETALARKRRARRINRKLAEFFPDARCELDFTNAFELLVATVLSAQTTDVRVNQITPKLFSRYPDAHALAADHDGQVPKTLEELTALAGVGRKTANVVLGNVFDVPGITVDTHVGRVARRLAWTESNNALHVERDIAELFEPKDWVMLCHRLIFLGRRVCHSRKPDCAGCPISKDCPAAFSF